MTEALSDLPPPHDQDSAARAWTDLRGEGTVLGPFEAKRSLLDAVFGGSPFLRDLILRDPDFARRVLATDPDQVLAGIIEGLTAEAEDEPEMRRLLRKSRGQAALAIALADLSGAWSLDQVTEALTRFAEAALNAALAWLLEEARRTGKLLSAKDEEAGYTILGMGKFGAHELNYSSDIDLIVLYDPHAAKLGQGVDPSTFFVRLTKRLVVLLQDVTEDGYAFRVDLRLRPDPRATQIAISIEAAAIYYENMGQNWERAAMIKARPVAGDQALGAEFLDRLVPYIWRKYLDFAAIADVQSLKRQIHAVKGHGTIAVLGHNIKLGRGGIREIEFFVQTQQLIAGGRNPKLRGKRTVDMLAALAEAKWISPEAARELSEAYRFLRTIEHRIQMVADEQTHTLPDDEAAFARLARFAGFAETADFAAKLRATFELVQGHYAALFKDAEDLGTEAGSLVFTGGEDDPETLETLTGMGFKRASEIAAMIRSWHFGRYSATRSARARERLTELMPALLTSLARSGDADQAFIAFDRFLAGLPTGVQLFSLLKSNPGLLDLIGIILGTAPRLAQELSHRPKVLDAVLDPGFFGALPKAAELAGLVAAATPPGTPIDEAIDRVRVVAKEQAFRIGVRILSETVSAAEAGGAFSDLADVVLERLHEAVIADMAERHGNVPGGRSALIAMGKLGGREMTAGSDLDLILIFDHDKEAEASDGARPLSAGQYFARLTQRFISAVTAPTAEGVLYEVDMRLRPSGNKGPVATSLASFTDYHLHQAWTWEALALTRARVVAGDSGLMEELRAVIAEALCRPRDKAKVTQDVVDMRRMMLKENAPYGVWDIKRAQGGLVDIEFIAQYLQIIHAHEAPRILAVTTLRALERLIQAGLIAEAEGSRLKAACLVYQRLTQVLRLCVSGPYNPKEVPAGLNRIVASASAMPDIASAEALIAETQAQIADQFARLVGPL
ncbi:bifunctional [glutamine synthetase] adenylyltransferase/[glutamine synthetase]-adenylyl-L-tyrosine phosphorylase [Nordella sp. HKS 07]|uniref:bifunctional [glutamine synthetase] adenylyltransferase/[glutamine synthetase]-adenylyl-L-tyrosine phosphorylase n=1 Tax=Nordella sp. HKS 07 TaxID=2712222 RepID=UPI0013E11697|nr:bifunctional [glutamine synthetase] adenylyltransferase/[glutamine synthetase]-adenylyl-L-tyrosine phosphorylase [Nordella sp. HKS 07]QIG49660.1 bifunctional [glutamine synthetase] adenylyltransferase/[glutamine synthetase]-adenylyl-L-tyrosine phosphorylase [Nordella sp. HKS 07]